MLRFFLGIDKHAFLLYIARRHFTSTKREEIVAEKLRIKKYTNRRLYDTDKNAYVTLHHVEGIIKQGRQVEVIDATSKEDVTAFILTQIILEEAKNKNVLLPVPLLHLLIQYGDTLLTEFFEKHLQQIIKSYIACKVSVDEQFVRWLDLSMNLTDAAKKTLFEMTPLKTILETFAESPAQKK